MLRTMMNHTTQTLMIGGGVHHTTQQSLMTHQPQAMTLTQGTLRTDTSQDPAEPVSSLVVSVHVCQPSGRRSLVPTVRMTV